MIVATGPVEILAFKSRIVDGNHNNAMLIDRVVERAWYQLEVLRGDILREIRAATPIYDWRN